MTPDEAVDLYRAIRGTYWSYQLGAYEDAALKQILPVVEEAGKRLQAAAEKYALLGDKERRLRAEQVLREMERLQAATTTAITGDIVKSSSVVGAQAVKEYSEIMSVGGLIRSSHVALSPSQFAVFFSEALPFSVPKVISGALDRAGMEALKQEIHVGALTGASYKKIVRDMRKQFPTLMKGDLTTLTRTVFQTANARAFDIVYEENQDILEGKTWISANDDRVCQQCLPLGGVTFLKGEAHPPMPLHPRCRCLFIPKTKPLGKLGADAKKVKERAEAIVLRGTMSEDGRWEAPDIGLGRILHKETFKVLPGGLRAGFTSLPDEVQISMVGPNRFDLLKAGRIRVEDLIDYKTGRAFTLDELKKMHP